MGNKILLVDDDGTTIKLLEARLTANAYQVITANNGHDGLRKAVSEQPDIIISDVVMPEMDGFAFYKELKKNESSKNIPVVILSSRGKMEDTFRVFEVDAFLTKPIDMQELLDVVKRKIGAGSPAAANGSASAAEVPPEADEEEEPIEEKKEDAPAKPAEVQPKQQAVPAKPVQQPVQQNAKISISGNKAPQKESERGKILIAGPLKLTKNLVLELRKKKYDVKPVEKGDDLVNIAAELLPDLVILDAYLGGQSAETAVRSIRKIRALKKITIILFDHLDKAALEVEVSVVERKAAIQTAKKNCIEAGATQAVGFYSEENLLTAVKLCLGY